MCTDVGKEYVKVATTPQSCSDVVRNTGWQAGTTGGQVLIGTKVLINKMGYVPTNTTSGTQHSFDHEGLSIVFRMSADKH